MLLTCLRGLWGSLIGKLHCFFVFFCIFHFTTNTLFFQKPLHSPYVFKQTLLNK